MGPWPHAPWRPWANPCSRGSSGAQSEGPQAEGLFALDALGTRRRLGQHALGVREIGDEVVLGGGELGRIVKIGDNYLTVEIAEGVQILLQKPAIQAVLPKGTIKAALD